MIYNLVAYLKVQFPTLSFVAEGWAPSSPDEALLVSDSGGTENHYTGRRDAQVQIISRSKAINSAKLNIKAVADDLKNRFGLVLPEVTVGTEVYPELKTYRIVKNQMPGYIGSSEDSSHEYSFNITVTLDYS